MTQAKRAIALAWTAMHPAPFVVASGKGYLAAHMLDRAEYHEIRIVKDATLAETLAEVPVGAYIPERTWRAVAAVFSFLDGIAEKRLFT